MRARALPAWVWVAAIVAGLVLSWLVAIWSGGPAAGSRHLFYVPIMLAAARFGAVSVAGTGVAATLLAGPLAHAGPLGVWLPRGPFYVGIGLLVWALVASVEYARQQEAAVAELRADLMAQKATLIQSVSHEFRTPLTILQGVASTLSTREDLVRPEARRLVGALLRGVDRMRDLVFVVLAAGDALGDDLEQAESVVDLERLVRQVGRALGDHDGSRVSVQCAPDARAIITVSPVCTVILRCLMDNALKYTTRGTRVEVVSFREEDTIHIEVRDHGPGMSAEEIEAAFEPFVKHEPTSPQMRGGLGVGLFSARRLAHRLGGDVRITPGDEGGLVARVSLPQRTFLIAPADVETRVS